MSNKGMLAFIFFLALVFLAGGIALALEKPQQAEGTAVTRQENPVSLMTQAMTERLTKNLHVKNIVGDPVKVGDVTIIPIIMIDIGYGGGGGGAGMGQQMGGEGFFMSGEAKPLGFVVITKEEVKFISAGKAPRK